MDHWTRYFRACKVTYTAYLRWQTDNLKIKGFHLHVCKKDVEVSRALMNVNRRRAYK